MQYNNKLKSNLIFKFLAYFLGFIVIGSLLSITVSKELVLPSTQFNRTTDSLALVTLKESFLGACDTSKIWGWDLDMPISSWEGVTLNQDKRVIELNLSNSCLAGELPREIGNFDKLEILNFSYNRIDGLIPQEIKSLKNLKSLDLSDNFISGVIPKEVGMLTNLINLNLSSNGLFREIPNFWANLVNLDSLNLKNNFISGNIPLEIGFLIKLKKLDFSNNELSGGIPEEIGNLTELIVLNLNNNSLAESIPKQIGLLTKLESIDFSSNDLTGNIPPEIGNLTLLTYLDLRQNQLSGIIPNQISNLKKISRLDLNRNLLTGNLPTELAALTNLILLDFSFNRLTGEFPNDLDKLTNLCFFNLINNKISGGVPKELENLNMDLYISDNNLSHLPDMSNGNIGLATLENNHFTFDDLLPNTDIFGTIDKGSSEAISPAIVTNTSQKNFIHDTFYIFSPCVSPIINLGIDSLVENNQYFWYREDSLLGTTEVNKIDLSDYLDSSDNYPGVYRAEVINKEMSGYKLTSNNITVKTTMEDNLSDKIIIINDSLCYGEQLKILGAVFDCSIPFTEGQYTNPETGCISNYTVDLQCYPCKKLLIPDVITPNGDGMNETFFIPQINEMPNIYGQNLLKIFNSKGDLVLEEVNYKNDWNGTDKFGKALPLGTYFYLFQFDENQSLISGNLTIIK